MSDEPRGQAARRDRGRPRSEAGRVARVTALWPAAAATALGAVGAAVMYLAANNWFGAGDLEAMLVWSIPPAVLLCAVLGPAARRLHGSRAFVRYAALVPLGGLVGVLWTMLAALILGGWVMAFSFPVHFCWVAGGLLGGIVLALGAAPRSWPAAVSLCAALLVALTRANAYSLAPEPRLRVVTRAGATEQDVQRVWDEVLGRPTTGRHELRPGITSVGRTANEGTRTVLEVSLSKRLNDGERAALTAAIRRSPLVERVDNVPASDTSGVRVSVSY